MWLHTPLSRSFVRQRQVKHCKFQASQSYAARPSQRKREVGPMLGDSDFPFTRLIQCVVFLAAPSQ